MQDLLAVTSSPRFGGQLLEFRFPQGDPHSLVLSSPSAIRSGLRSAGAVLLRGYSTRSGDLQQVADLFGKGDLLFPSRHRKNFARGVQTVYLVPSNLPLHSEAAGQPDRLWPQVALLHCIRPATDGGETLLCSATELADQLPIAIRNFLNGRRFRFKYRFQVPEIAGLLGVPEANVQAELATAGIEFRFNNGSISYEYVVPCLPTIEATGRPGFVAPVMLNSSTPRYNRVRKLWVRNLMGNPGKRGQARQRLPGNHVCFSPTWETGWWVSKRLCRIIAEAARSLTFEVKWEAGDVLIWDNRRYLHGRNSYKGERFVNVGWRSRLLE